MKELIEDDETEKKDEWEELPPNPKCKKCEGRGYDAEGEDCTCTRRKIK